MFTKTCTQMFIVTLLIITQTGNNPFVFQLVKEQTMVHPNGGILLKQKGTNHWHAGQYDESKMHYAKWKKPDPRLHDSTQIIF